MSIFLATLGQRPEAITMALDALREDYDYDFHTVAILHTEPNLSGIADAYAALRDCLKNDYPDIQLQWHELLQSDKSALFDIRNQATATEYYRAIYSVLLEYKRLSEPLHLMVSGGRKAMSIYATLAAGLIFSGQDKVWTILSPSILVNQEHVFHAPPHLREQVHMVQLPVQPARLLPGSVPAHFLEDPANFTGRSSSSAFWQKLSPQEAKLVEVILQKPYVRNQELADSMHKSKRTVETQLRSIYAKLIAFLDFGEEIHNKRQALLDILNQD